MPKKQKSESVFHDWVHELTFQMQALLTTAMRGPDGSQKEDDAKIIIRYLRGVVLKPAGDWKGENDNNFMWGEFEYFPAFTDLFWDDHDHYPHHFIMHLVHCAEVVGYLHPDETIRRNWLDFYFKGCDSFHMKPETQQDLIMRLNDFGCGYKEKTI